MSVGLGNAAIAAPGGSGEVVVALSIAPTYHLMSDRPSAPQYVPTRVHLEDADGVAFGEPKYPSATSWKLADRDIATFQGTIEVHVPFRTAAGAAPGERTVKGTLRYQSCTEVRCLFPVTRAFETRVRVPGGE